MEAVCIMFNVPPLKVPDPNKPGAKLDDYWNAAKTQLLQDPKKLLDMLLHYDRESIQENMINKITPYINNPDFTPENISKASKACEAICMWVHAMHKFYHVNK
jgi:dynein heavy chain